jgi:methyl-accepting chemotaxis protein
MRVKFYPLFIIAIIIATMLMGLLAYNGVNNVSNYTNGKMSKSIKIADQIINLSSLLSDISYRNFMLASNDSLTVQYINSVHEKMSSDIKKMSQIINNIDFSDSNIQKTWKDFKSYFLVFKSTYTKVNDSDIIGFMQSDLRTLMVYASSEISSLKTSISGGLFKTKEYIFWALILTLTIEILLVVFLFLTVFRPLTLLLHRLKRLLSGDLTHNIDLKHSGVFKPFVKDLIAFKNKINESFLNVDKTTSSIKKKTEIISENSESFLSQTNSFLSREDDILETAFKLKDSVSSLLDNANKSLDLVDKTVKLVNNTGMIMSETNNSVEIMFSNSRKLEEIFNFIDQIALQTNILAINASVEASKAGEYGKTFAVITKDIRDLSIKISKYSEDSKELINSNIDSIEMVKNLSEKVMVSFADMQRMFTDLDKEIEIIGKDIPEEHLRINKITQDINELDGILKSYVSNIESLTLLSNEIFEDSKSLGSAYSDFKLKRKDQNGKG